MHLSYLSDSTFHLSVSAPVSLPFCLSVSTSSSDFTSLSVCFCLFVILFMPLCISAYLLVCILTCLRVFNSSSFFVFVLVSVPLSLFLSLFANLFICPSCYLSSVLFLFLFFCMPLSIFLLLPVCIFLRLRLSLVFCLSKSATLFVCLSVSDRLSLIHSLIISVFLVRSFINNKESLLLLHLLFLCGGFIFPLFTRIKGV